MKAERLIRTMDNRGFRWNGIDLLHKLTHVPKELIHWAKGKTATLMFENSQLHTMQGIQIRNERITALKNRLKRPQPKPTALPASEQALIEHIRQKTAYHNRNNVTRTLAYWSLYQSFPELHWAFLAHMVSRNGGWNMTDLNGEWLPYLLSEEQRGAVFSLLERANALIFHDAYPQLLLYAASRKMAAPLFHLLPYLQVSCFMRAVWEMQWEQPDPALLTQALIINEQHYIEQRVVQHPAYRDLVLNTLFFNAQSLLQLNQVVFPYNVENNLLLAGLVLGDFKSLANRIEAGKKLYAILFGIPIITQGTHLFAADNSHTGSRADYWPHLFAPIRRSAPVPRGQLKEWLDGCQLRPDASPLYSPRLTNAWKNSPMIPPEPGDWFLTDKGNCISFLSSLELPFAFEMTYEHCFGLKKIELAVLAGDILK